MITKASRKLVHLSSETLVALEMDAEGSDEDPSLPIVTSKWIKRLLFLGTGEQTVVLYQAGVSLSDDTNVFPFFF